MLLGGQARQKWLRSIHRSKDPMEPGSEASMSSAKARIAGVSIQIDLATMLWRGPVLQLLDVCNKVTEPIRESNVSRTKVLSLRCCGH